MASANVPANTTTFSGFTILNCWRRNKMNVTDRKVTSMSTLVLAVIHDPVSLEISALPSAPLINKK